MFPPSRADEPLAALYRTTGVPDVKEVVVDLKAYYDKAIEQCVREVDDGGVDYLPWCVSGNLPETDFYMGRFHHITADTTLDGGKDGKTIDGIIYMETGTKLTIKGKVTINGTIVHEGGKYNGGVVSGPNMELVINSYDPVDTFSRKENVWYHEPAFSPGAAIVGGPTISWANNANLGPSGSTAPGIRGYVMAGSGFQSYWNTPSTIAASGIIEGGVIGVNPEPNDDPYTGTLYLKLNTPGPVLGNGTWAPPVKYAIWEGKVELGGSANIRFKPLTTAVTGLPQTGGSSTPSVTRPTVRYWTVN